VLSTTLSTSVNFSKRSVSPTLSREQASSRPENAEEVLDERVGDAFNETEADKPHNKRDDDDEEGWVVNDIYPDGGTVIGFFDTSHPQPWDNSQRLYSVDDPHHPTAGSSRRTNGRFYRSTARAW